MTDKLKEIIQKLINIWRESIGWTCFPGVHHRGFPIPFFGRINTEKPLIFTLGANPSNREFLTDKGDIIKESRFPMVSKKPKVDADALFYACCEYFSADNNPNKTWFGKHAKNEALLNCFQASYYDNDKQYQAAHIDLMPFPTLCKFSTIQKNPFFQMLIASYGIPLIAQLIKDFHPHKVICISTFVCESLLETIPGKNGVKYYKGDYGGIPFCGSSIYYPNSIRQYEPEDVAKQMNSFLKIECQKNNTTFHSSIDFGQVLTQYLK